VSAVASDRPVVLFVCVHSAGRSQMAAGLLRKYADGAIEVRSAGTAPSEEIDPSVVTAMDEVGVDLSDAVPTLLETEAVERADVVVTMGCGDACPVFPGKRYLDWELPDPAGLPVDEVRPIRDAIDERVQGLVQDLLG
jgi:arsenate reductase